MHISDFMNLKILEDILEDWSLTSDMATIALDQNGKYISKEIGFTDFCMKYTRGSAEGARRCKKCDEECIGTYFCHAGLMDFSIDIKVGDTNLGKIIGGQILPKEPNEENFRQLAIELGVNPDDYIKALRKIPRKSEEGIRAAAKLLGDIVNMIVNFEYLKQKSETLLHVFCDQTDTAVALIEELNKKTMALDKIENKQKMLSLNASIEAARANEYGRGFSVVANEVGKLAGDSGLINKSIKETLHNLTDIIFKMEEAKNL